MMKTLITILTCLMLYFTGTARAQVYGPKQQGLYLGTKIAGLAINSTRTFSLTFDQNRGLWGLLTVYISLTDSDNSVTALNMSCTGSWDNNTTNYTLQSCTTASGVCTSSNASWTKDPSGITSPKRWPWRVDIEGIEDMVCTFTSTGATGSDLLTVDVTISTKGG